MSASGKIVSSSTKKWDITSETTSLQWNLKLQHEAAQFLNPQFMNPI